MAFVAVSPASIVPAVEVAMALLRLAHGNVFRRSDVRGDVAYVCVVFPEVRASPFCPPLCSMGEADASISTRIVLTLTRQSGVVVNWNNAGSCEHAPQGAATATPKGMTCQEGVYRQGKIDDTQGDDRGRSQMILQPRGNVVSERFHVSVVAHIETACFCLLDHTPAADAGCGGGWNNGSLIYENNGSFQEPFSSIQCAD